MIKLFESTETIFEDNGLGTLNDALSCVVKETINGEYELELSYPVNGIHYEDITFDRLILCKPNDYDQEQPFRIYEISKPINGIITVNAEHWSYDLSNIPVKGAKDHYLAWYVSEVYDHIKKNAFINHNFNFYTEVLDERKHIDLRKPRSIRSFMGDTDNSILQLFGGEWAFDLYNITLKKRRGQNRDVIIEYGKNLIDISQEENISNMYTDVYPFYYVEDDGLQDIEELVHINDNIRTTILTLDLTSEFENMPTRQELLEKTKEYVSKNKLDRPKISIKVSFIKNPDVLNELQDVRIGDDVTVKFVKLGINSIARCLSYEYNVLTGQYESIDIGDPYDDLSSSIFENKNTILDEIVRAKDAECKLRTLVKATEDSILLTVSSSEKKWDEKTYTIQWYGYGYPDVISDDLRIKDYYLDQTNGYLYECTAIQNSSNVSWKKIDQLQSMFTKTEESAIRQSKNEILATVASNMREWDEKTYTVQWYGYGYPNIDNYYLNVYDYYLNQSDGYLYRCTSVFNKYDEDGDVISKTGNWSLVEKLKTKLSNVESQISQTPHTIELGVSSDKGSASITITVKDSDGNKLSESSKSISLNADTISLTADNIINFLANETINLTSNNVTISSDNFNVDAYGNVSTNTLNTDSGLTVNTKNGSSGEKGGIYCDRNVYAEGNITAVGGGNFDGIYTENGVSVGKSIGVGRYRNYWEDFERYRFNVDESGNTSFDGRLTVSNGNNKSGAYVWGNHEVTGNLRVYGGYNVFGDTSKYPIVLDANAGYIRPYHYSNVAPWDPVYTSHAVCLGSSDYPFYSLSLFNDPWIVSDKRLKTDIRILDERYYNLLIDLQSVLYHLKGNEKDNLHSGFLAQDVEKLMAKHGISESEFAFLSKKPKYKEKEFIQGYKEQVPVLDENGNQDYHYSIAYGELISVLTYGLQIQDQKIRSLEERINVLEKQTGGIQNGSNDV